MQILDKYFYNAPPEYVALAFIIIGIIMLIIGMLCSMSKDDENSKYTSFDNSIEESKTNNPHRDMNQ